MDYFKMLVKQYYFSSFDELTAYFYKEFEKKADAASYSLSRLRSVDKTLERLFNKLLRLKAKEIKKIYKLFSRYNRMRITAGAVKGFNAPQCHTSMPVAQRD